MSHFKFFQLWTKNINFKKLCLLKCEFCECSGASKHEGGDILSSKDVQSQI